ncbi:Do/DeqQ family serine protease [Psychroflexus salarius]|uniref:Do/DeqQ family serine protease n=1 Tax=Psychroflexus salarius TaxID=1155689 RepID=A0A1M4W2P2_9FLAO|nr:trypsin-like peptidase domain-containing protein [Psychroflexus salarius]SHE75420.1 Do/DeqQ family serine protease [Psychroflexus salarius]
MKEAIKLIIITIIVSTLSIGVYHYSVSTTQNTSSLNLNETQPIVQQSSMPVNYSTNYAAEETDFTTAAKTSLDAVVHVKNVTVTKSKGFWGFGYGYNDEPRKYIRGAGSGVIISPDGYIVTNNHVIDGATEVDVTLNNNETFKAEIIGTAPEYDIALLKIDRDNLNYLSFGDSNAVEVGEWVLAIGNPFNLTSTVTAGIISAKARDLNPNDNLFQSFIQTDAAVNPGNSGGALVNAKGQLIGINTAITSKTGSYIGYSFAIPSNNAKKIIDDLIEYGSIKQALLGVSGLDINEKNYKELNIDVTQGYYITGFAKDGSAENAGLKKGDIITKIDQIKIRKFTDLKGYLNSKNPGDIVEVTYLRNGKQMKTSVELMMSSTYIIKPLGLQIRNLEKDEYKTFDSDNGVMIDKALSPKLSMFEGLLITKINKRKVNSISEVKQILQTSNNQPLIITFKNSAGQEDTYIFR